MPPQTYVSVPTEIQALQWTGTNVEEVRSFTHRGIEAEEKSEAFHYDFYVTRNGDGNLWVQVSQTFVKIVAGEWVLKDQLGFYPCKDEIFAQKYKLLE